MNIIIDNYMKGLQRAIKYLSLLDQLQKFHEKHGNHVLSNMLILVINKSANEGFKGKILRHQHERIDVQILRNLGLIIGYDNRLTTLGKDLAKQIGIKVDHKIYRAKLLQIAHKDCQAFKNMTISSKITYILGILLLGYMFVCVPVVAMLVAFHTIRFVDAVLAISIFLAEVLGLKLIDSQNEKYRYLPNPKSKLDKELKSFTEAKFIQFILSHDLVIKHLDQLNDNAGHFDDMFVPASQKDE